MTPFAYMSDKLRHDLDAAYEKLRECDHARELLGSYIAQCRALGVAPDPDVLTAYDVLQASVGARP